ncbi:MAG: hypothetical protein KDA25_09425 [Phycisphaerales bacterium]|nr:hypothetical protein [Phycisphaerales bacterium]
MTSHLWACLASIAVLASGATGQPGTPEPCGGDHFSQSTDASTILPRHTFQCATPRPAVTLENGVARSFDLGASAPYVVLCVEFGIESSTGGDWPVVVNIYAGDINGPFEDLTLLGTSEPVLVPSGARGTMMMAHFMDVVEIAPGAPMIVELHTDSRVPDDGTRGGVTIFGSNAAGESGPTFLRAPSCSATGFVPMASLGSPDVHVVMTVMGILDPPPVPAGEVCGAGGAVCGADHETPGCFNDACCSPVCFEDPFCCDVAWDEPCVARAIAICVPVDPLPQCAPPPSDMVAWWRFDEAGGPTAYESVGGRNGTLGGGAARSPNAYVSHSISFDGIDDRVTVPNHPSLNFGLHGSMSMDAWVWHDPALNPYTGNSIVSKFSAYKFMTFPVGFGLHVHLGGSGPMGCYKVLPTKAWKHVTVTIDQSVPNQCTILFYVDGLPFGTPNVQPQHFNLSSNDPVLIGSSLTPTQAINSPYGGFIDEVELFDRVLTPAEIMSIYQAGVAGKCRCTPPVLECPLTVSCVGGKNYVPFDGGIADDFCGATEPATPSAALAPLCSNPQDFDSTLIDGTFCHSLVGLPSNIAEAKLEIRLRANGAGCCNDSLSFQATGGFPALLWSSRIGSDGGGCGGFPGLVPWEWTPGTMESMCLDLANLPVTGGATTNLLPSLNATQRLDIHVQDDTAVDFVRLWITTCPPCSGDINESGIVDAVDLAGLLANWGTDDPASDLDGDGIVSAPDLATLLANWGPCR